jgi:phenylacetate-CoA ligase
MLERLYRWHGLDPNASLAVIRFLKRNKKAAWPDGLAGGPWSLDGPHGTSHFLNNTTPAHRQAEWLSRTRPRYLSTNPSNLDALADELGAAGRDVGLEAVITVGEILTPETRRRVAESLGAKVIDTYGCQELGKVALECPESGLLHICAENMIVEVLDGNDQPVMPGETGRVVLTGFYNLAMPLIRYAIGDYAETAPGPCSCGRTLPALTRVLGRQRNMFVFADNTRIWPRTAIVTGLGGLLPLKQFKMIQTAVDRVELLYVPIDRSHEPDLDAIRTRLRANLHPTIDVTLNAVDHIPYGAGGKFEDFVSLVAPNSTRLDS